MSDYPSYQTDKKQHGELRDEWRCTDCGKKTEYGLTETNIEECGLQHTETSDTFRCVVCGIAFLQEERAKINEVIYKMMDIKEKLK